MSLPAAVVPPWQDLDLREFLDHPRPVLLDDDEHAAVRSAHLPAGVLAVLDHLRRGEQATLDWLRDVLLTPTNLVGPAITAGHLAGALADTLAQRVMAIRLAQLAPPLGGLAGAILHSTERHVAFFTAQVHARGGHRLCRAAVRHALRRWRWPAPRRGDRGHLAAVMRYLLGHPCTRDLVVRADSALAVLPGAPARAVLRTEISRFVVHGTTWSQLRVQ